MNKQVTIYTTPTCGYCQLAKEFFKEHGITFQEIDVSRDQQKARQMIEKSGQMGVPVIVVGEGAEEQLIVGFNQPRLAAALGVTA